MQRTPNTSARSLARYLTMRTFVSGLHDLKKQHLCSKMNKTTTKSATVVVPLWSVRPGVPMCCAPRLHVTTVDVIVRKVLLSIPHSDVS